MFKEKFRSETEQMHAIPLLLHEFQDDMLQVAVGKLSERMIDQVERKVIFDRAGY